MNALTTDITTATPGTELVPTPSSQLIHLIDVNYANPSVSEAPKGPKHSLCTANIVFCRLKQPQDAALDVFADICMSALSRALTLTSCLGVRGCIARHERNVKRFR